MAKNGYSRKGFFGETIHYDANGKKVGESRKNFWGGYDHFDVSSKKTGTSREGFFGGMNHYDNNGHKTGHSHQGFWGRPTTTIATAIRLARVPEASGAEQTIMVADLLLAVTPSSMMTMMSSRMRWTVSMIPTRLLTGSKVKDTIPEILIYKRLLLYK